MRPLKDYYGTALDTRVVAANASPGAMVDVQLDGAQFDVDSFVCLSPRKARLLARRLVVAACEAEDENRRFALDLRGEE